MPKKELPPSDEGDSSSKKKSRFKLIMILTSLLFLFGGLGGGGYWWFFARPGATGIPFFNESAKEESIETTLAREKEGTQQDKGASQGASQGTSKGQSTESDQKDGKEQEGKYGSGSASPSDSLRPVSLPTLTVNLADPPGNRYLKIGMDVEVTSHEAAKKLEQQSARVRDSLILSIATKNVKELVSPAGKILLKNEVAARLNQILGAPQVIRIFFTEFMIQ